MRILLKMLMAQCWGNIYLLIGISIGLTLSFLFMPIDPSVEYQLTKSLSGIDQDYVDDYEPKINIDAKPQKARKALKPFIRPRYYSTELGIREKLFIGILTDSDHLYTRGVGLNKTIAHAVNKIRYFISISEGTKPNISLPGIVGFTDTRKILKPFHTVKYIIDNYLEDYDYYFIIKDTGYVNARRLVRMVNKIAVSQNVHVGGIASSVSTYCSLDSGILMSNSVVRRLKTNLDWCVKNTYSDSDDVNFGRCVLHSTSIPCSNGIQGQIYGAWRLGANFVIHKDLANLTGNKKFDNSIVIHPIYDHLDIYKLHAYFTAVEAINVEKEISAIREASARTASSCPINRQRSSWPIGSRPPNDAAGRFDVLRWAYFNETHALLDSDRSNVREMGNDARLDIERATKVATEWIIQKYNRTFKLKKLSNVYRKFDASRGMDYTIDILLAEQETGITLRKRVELCKPLGSVEILPVSYVTENTRINMILIVDLRNLENAIDFVSHYGRVCMEGKHKTFLMLALLYNHDTPSKGKDDAYRDLKKRALHLTEKFKKDRSKIAWLSVRLPAGLSSIATNPMIEITVADLCSRKLPAESLILFVETKMELSLDYLNRVRMNTINQYQVYSPIPFIEFHPDIIHANSPQNSEFDVNRNFGKYDELNYNSIAFYAKDYDAMRKTIQVNVPLVRSDRDIDEILKISKEITITSLFEMFVSFSDLHAFRAIEPALKIRYKEVECQSAFHETHLYNNCVSHKYLQLGQRGQLAKLLLDYQHFRE